MRLKRDARTKGGFYVEPEAKLMFVMRLLRLLIIARRDHRKSKFGPRHVIKLN